MKLLYISPSPPNNMERMRTSNLLRGLKSLGYDITLICLYNKKQEKYINNARRYASEVITIKYNKIIALFNAALTIFRPIPARVGYCYNKKLIKVLNTLNEKYDVCYIKRLRMAQYVPYIKTKKIIDITDSLTKYYERMYKQFKGIKRFYFYIQYKKIKRYELNICQNNKNIVICSQQDKNYISELLNEPCDNINVIDNVVNVEDWKTNNIRINKKNERNKLAFLGIMNYKPNILAVEYLIKNIMNRLPEKYTLEIIGGNVPKSLKKLENSRIKFLGYVDDVRSKLKTNDIFVCPILAGSGTKNKIMQAAEVGLPIVCTTLSIEGLCKETENNVFIANDSNDFINQIEQVNILEEQVLKNKIKNEKKLIEEKNSIDWLSKRLENLLKNIK